MARGWQVCAGHSGAQAGHPKSNVGYSGAQAGHPTPNAGYSGAQAGLFTPNAGYMNPHMGVTMPTAGYPFMAVPNQHLPHGLAPGMGFPQLNPDQSLSYHYPTSQQGTSSSASTVQSHDDLVSPFLTQAEDREFRDSECETDSDEEAGVRPNREKLQLSPQTATLLAEMVSKPLKNTKCRQLLEHFPHQQSVTKPIFPS